MEPYAKVVLTASVFNKIYRQTDPALPVDCIQKKFCEKQIAFLTFKG